MTESNQATSAQETTSHVDSQVKSRDGQHSTASSTVGVYDQETPTNTSPTTTSPTPASSSNMMWMILLIVLIIIAFFILRQWM